MESKSKATAWLAAAMLAAAGCASGGGGDGIQVESRPIPQPTATAELRCLWFLPFICAWYEPGADADEPSSEAGFRFSSIGSQRPAPFASWSELAADQVAEFDALGTKVTYAQTASGAIAATSVRTPPQQEVLASAPRYTAAKDLAGESLGRIADGIDVSISGVGDATQMGVIANPYAQGWNYQSFGVWNTHGPGTREIASFSFGAPTPASAVPSSGAASFAGRLGAIYVSPGGQASIATADVRVNADFSNRSLGFASSGTTLTQDLKSSIAAPQLNLGGTLTYSPATNTFSGTLTNAGGTMSGSSTGRYYGPAAQELGGVLTVKSPNTAETLTGAYGAKR